MLEDLLDEGCFTNLPRTIEDLDKSSRFFYSRFNELITITLYHMSRIY